MGILIFPTTLLEKFITLRRTERDVIKNVYWSSCKVAGILVRFSWNLKLLDRFSKSVQISNFIKLRPTGTKLFHADGRADVAKLIVAVRNFVNASKNHTRLLSSFLVLRSIILNMLSTENYLFIGTILIAAPCSLSSGSSAQLASHRPLPPQARH